MKLRHLRWLTLAAIGCLALPALATAQDFNKTYRLEPGGTVNIRAVSGNIRVSGTDSPAVVVTAYKEGRDRDQVEIVDRSSANSVDVRDKYPENCQCDVGVRFEVQVPKGLNLTFNSISSVSGSVEVSNVTGKLAAKSVSGNVAVRNITGPVQATSVSGNVIVGEIHGTVSAKSTSGEVKVDITQLEGSEGMEFASISGDVIVTMPPSLDAEVEMSVLSGDLKTDFPLTIEKKENGPGQKAHGMIGNGSRKVRLTSVSGDVRLLKYN
jgi:DUF4097 and DUF4098 domain-containing protein YvlB